MNGWMQGIVEVIGGDLNGHVEKSNMGYVRVHGRFGFSYKSLMGDSILEYEAAYDLAIANKYFKKRDEHLVTFKVRPNLSQTYYFSIKRRERSACKDYKVVPGKSLTTILIFSVRFIIYTPNVRTRK